ncbi:MAG: sigma-70 family RNA polymerase sigma factor, partial [Actinomycetota bacterium]|nr:sigma-70 family RNA polymerase sigma factor [Actinomycetota bacterium]
MPQTAPAPRDDLIRGDQRRSDAELVRAAQGGDGDALAVLFRRHLGVAVGVASRLLRCRVDVDDAVGDAFANVLEHLGALRQPDSFRAFLLACVRNAAHDRRRLSCVVDASGIDGRDHAARPVEAAVEAADEAARLVVALEELPTRQRYVLRRFYWDEAPVAGIAGELGLSVNATTQLLFRARAGLA